MLAGHGYRGTRRKTVPRTSHTTLAEIVGGTRSRTNGVLRKFETLGFIEMDGSLTVHRSLLRIVSPCLRVACEIERHIVRNLQSCPRVLIERPAMQRRPRRPDNDW
jgi:hypothetical protein